MESIASETEENFKTKSVLQAKLSNLAIQIGYIGLVVAAATVIILFVRFSITKYIIKKEEFSKTDMSFFIKFIITGVTVLVIAVPEGLPLAITLALTYSVKKVSQFYITKHNLYLIMVKKNFKYIKIQTY